MAHALRNTAGYQPALTIPTKREIEMLLLTSPHQVLEPFEELEEDDDLTNIKYYSPTAD